MTRLSLPTLALSLLIPSLGMAQEAVCAPYVRLVQTMAALKKQTPAAMGKVSAQGALVLLSTADGASFTLLVVGTDGNACILATGEGWASDVIAAGRAL